MKPLLNTADALLRAGRSSLFGPLLKRAGIAPRELWRGPHDGSFSSPSLLCGEGVHIHGPMSVSLARVSAVFRTLSTGRLRGKYYPAQYLIVGEDLHEQHNLHRFVLDHVRRVASEAPPNSRIVLLSLASAEGAGSWRASACAAGLEGFTRSLAKELGGSGTTVNCLVVDAAAALPPPLAAATQGSEWLTSPASFFLLPDAAFITGQTLHLQPPSSNDAAASCSGSGGSSISSSKPALAGKAALVTGAARGIGAAIAARLVREGARVIGVDVPAAGSALAATMAALSAKERARPDGSGGSAVPLELDVAAPDAPADLRSALLAMRSGEAEFPVDIVVHNAGVTRDRMLRAMAPDGWDAVCRVNFEGIARMNAALGLHGTAALGSSSPKPMHRDELLVSPHHGRVIMLSSINGIAGARGQTNYSWTKGAIIGYTEWMAQQMKALSAAHARPGAASSMTAMAVAPGFIETKMTTSIPFVLRQLGRRANAVGQGGLPEDVAAAIAYLSLPGAAALSGQVLRVCGGNMVGK